MTQANHPEFWNAWETFAKAWEEYDEYGCVMIGARPLMVGKRYTELRYGNALIFTGEVAEGLEFRNMARNKDERTKLILQDTAVRDAIAPDASQQAILFNGTVEIDNHAYNGVRLIGEGNSIRVQYWTACDHDDEIRTEFVVDEPDLIKDDPSVAFLSGYPAPTPPWPITRDKFMAALAKIVH